MTNKTLQVTGKTLQNSSETKQKPGKTSRFYRTIILTLKCNQYNDFAGTARMHHIHADSISTVHSLEFLIQKE